MPRDLYERCWGCRGTRKLMVPVHVDRTRTRGENLQPGTDCPLCQDGYQAIGMTVGQAEALVARNERLRAVADAAGRYVRSLAAGMPVLAEKGGASLSFRAAAEQSTAALRDLKDALGALGNGGG